MPLDDPYVWFAGLGVLGIVLLLAYFLGTGPGRKTTLEVTADGVKAHASGPPTTTVDVGNAMELNGVDMGNLTGLDGADPASVDRVTVGNNLSATNSTIGDITGARGPRPAIKPEKP